MENFRGNIKYWEIHESCRAVTLKNWSNLYRIRLPENFKTFKNLYRRVFRHLSNFNDGASWREKVTV